MILKFIGFLISLAATLALLNIFCFMLVGFIDVSSLNDTYLFITFTSLTFVAVFYFLKEYTSFYDKYGIHEIDE